MSDKGVIIKEVCHVLNGALEQAVKNKAELESTAWWTEQVMTQLCHWGLRKNWWVGAAGVDKRKNLQKYAKKHGGTIRREWLYDFTCLEYDNKWLKGIPLIAECEWSKPDDIDADFQKLLLARADIRLMIFNGNYYRKKGKTLIESNDESPAEPYRLHRFCSLIARCEHTSSDDTYLLAARLHENQGGESVCHRFEFYRIDASTVGKVCIQPVR